MKNEVLTIQEISKDLQTQMQFCVVLFASGLCPPHLKTPEAIFTSILYGRELGLAVTQSIHSIFVINGKPTLPAETIKALVYREGGRIETIKWDNNECTLKMYRGDHSETYTYTRADAIAGKVKNLETFGKQMLYARCASILGRNMYPDILKGFYSREEMQTELDITPKEESLKTETIQQVFIPQMQVISKKPAGTIEIKPLEKVSELGNGAQVIEKRGNDGN